MNQKIQWKFWFVINTPEHTEQIAKCYGCGRELRAAHFQQQRQQGAPVESNRFLRRIRFRRRGDCAAAAAE